VSSTALPAALRGVPGGEHIATLLRHHRRVVARFVVSAAMRSLLSLSAILLIREFLAGIVNEGSSRSGLARGLESVAGPTAALFIIAALLLSAYAGASVFNYNSEVAQQRIIKILELGMMERLIRHLLRLSVPFFDRQSHGDIIQAVRQDVSELRMVVMNFGRIFVESMTATGLLVSALWLSPGLTVLALLVMPVAVLPVYLIAKRTLQRSYEVRKSGYVLFDVLLQLLRGIRVIKAYRGEEEEERVAIEKGRRYFDELIEMVRIRSLAQVVLESLAGLGVVVVVIVGGLEVMRGHVDWPTLLALLMAVRALHGPVNNINTAYVEIKRFGAGVNRVAQILAVTPEVADRPDARPLASAPQVIELDRVSFSYDDKRVLHDLSFRVAAGEMIGIAGPSGGGKTTLLNLIARFYDPSSGAVRFDGHDLRDYRLANLYDKLAIVTQEPFLFSSSVSDNIRCGRPGATDLEVEAAARAAEIDQDIRELPDGYATLIGLGGHGLSTGQAQRVTIARAILKNAPLLLLDEATSSLDSVAEAKVQDALDRLLAGRTTFVVAHRLSTLREADRILVLDAGRCVAFAPHDMLLETCDLYHQLWSAQAFSAPTSRHTKPVTEHSGG
jgi:ABC-type multidrug transport system fused ATPase/permease subunit